MTIPNPKSGNREKYFSFSAFFQKKGFNIVGKKLYIFFYTIIFLFLFPIFPYASELTFLYDCAEKNVAIYVSTFQLKTQRILLHTIRTGSFFCEKNKRHTY